MRHTFLIFLLSFSILQGQEQNILLRTPTGDIAGTLMLPENGVSAMPLVLIVAGSGPTDRNCNSMGMESNAYQYLAEALSRNGIASVRYDKRGVGQSDMGLNAPEDARIETYAEDVNSWIEYLSNDRRFGKLVIAGHSEGSLLGMLAIEKTKKAHGFISIAGAGRPVDEVLKEQLAYIHESARSAMYNIIDKLKQGDTIPNIPPIYSNFFRPSIQPFLISWMKYDPAAEIRKLKVPGLILQGSTDIQVKELDAELLAKARPEARLRIIRNMSHVMKEFESTDKKAQIEHYNDTDAPLHPEIITEIVSFVQAL